MRLVTLGTTGIMVPQNAFGALPIQRISKKDAVYLLRKAYDGGMLYFDTARAYTDSEEKLGEAFGTGSNRGVFLSCRQELPSWVSCDFGSSVKEETSRREQILMTLS